MSEFHYPVYLFPAFVLKENREQLVANNDEELVILLKELISASPTGEVLISSFSLAGNLILNKEIYDGMVKVRNYNMNTLGVSSTKKNI